MPLDFLASWDVPLLAGEGRGGGHLEKAVLNCESRCGAPVSDAEFVKNRAQVCMDGAAAEKERLGDLGIRHAACDQA